jgi:hypothetical protein
LIARVLLVFQRAKIVSALVAVGLYGEVRAEPPVGARNQPTNVEPINVGFAGRVSEPPVWNEEFATALPPKVSNVTTLVLALHCAKSVNPAVLLGL